jgi:tRNA(Ile)-lysidine synthase
VDSESIDRKAFRYGHPAVQRRMILELAWEHGVEPDFDRVLAAVDHIVHGDTGRFCDLGKDLQLCNGKLDTLLVQSERRRYRQRQAELGVPGVVSMLGQRLEARLLDDPPSHDLRTYCSPQRQVFDADRLGEIVAVRTVKDGDRFAPLGLDGTKKVGDYFTDIGLPAPARGRQILLEANGEIVWVVGHAVGVYAAVKPDTKRFAEVVVGAPAE